MPYVLTSYTNFMYHNRRDFRVANEVAVIQNYAKFWKCALQVNPWTYAQQYQGATKTPTEADYNGGILQACLKHEIQVVGIADHGCVDGVDNLRTTLEAKGIVVFPGFEIASTEKVHMVCLYPCRCINSYLEPIFGQPWPSSWKQ